MLRYAITSCALYPGDERQQLGALLQEAARWAADGVDFIQLREKDLSAACLAALSRQILQAIRFAASQTRLLINSRPDIAVATGAHGVHLSAAPDELTPSHVRRLYAAAKLDTPIITVSCHTLDDVQRARVRNADAILFAPVFEKTVAGRVVASGQGLEALRAACVAASPTPVYALGGVTMENTAPCLNAGAAGVAGIRLFHDL